MTSLDDEIVTTIRDTYTKSDKLYRLLNDNDNDYDLVSTDELKAIENVLKNELKVVRDYISLKEMPKSDTAKELKDLGHLLIETSLNFTHPRFKESYPEWSTVCGVGERLIRIAKKEVAE